MPKIGVLVIHGVGGQGSGFYKPLRDELGERLGPLAHEVAWQPVYWAPVLQHKEEALWKHVKDTGAVNQLALRKFALKTAADALSYRQTSRAGITVYSEIHDAVGEAVEQLHTRVPAGTGPTVVLAHSLGAQIMSDYIWDRQKGDSSRESIPDLVGFITFGCNLPLFAMACTPPRPILVPDPSAGHQALAAWHNYYDPDDVLGWPLRPLYAPHLDELDERQRQTVNLIQDRNINTGWIFGAHTGYWTDDDFTKPVASYLKQVIEAV